MIYNESIIITDTEKFAEGEGYGWDFKFKAAYNDSLLLSNTNNHRSLAAIDASMFGYGRAADEQFSEKVILREINKAYIGF